MDICFFILDRCFLSGFRTKFIEPVYRKIFIKHLRLEHESKRSIRGTGSVENDWTYV